MVKRNASYPAHTLEMFSRERRRLARIPTTRRYRDGREVRYWPAGARRNVESGSPAGHGRAQMDRNHNHWYLKYFGFDSKYQDEPLHIEYPALSESLQSVI